MLLLVATKVAFAALFHPTFNQKQVLIWKYISVLEVKVCWILSLEQLVNILNTPDRGHLGDR